MHQLQTAIAVHWNTILAEVDSPYPEKVDFLFFFQTKDERELTYLFKRDNFRHPVSLDRENRLERMNRFPSPMEYRCFLLDGEKQGCTCRQSGAESESMGFIQAAD